MSCETSEMSVAAAVLAAVGILLARCLLTEGLDGRPLWRKYVGAPVVAVFGAGVFVAFCYRTYQIPT